MKMEIDPIKPDLMIRDVDMAVKVDESIKAIHIMIYQLAKEIENIQIHINIMKSNMVFKG